MALFKKRRRKLGIARKIFRRGRLSSPVARFLFFRTNPIGRMVAPLARKLGI